MIPEARSPLPMTSTGRACCTPGPASAPADRPLPSEAHCTTEEDADHTASTTDEPDHHPGPRRGPRGRRTS